MANGDGMELVGLPELKKNLSFVEREVFPRAMARALNRTAKTVRTRSARSIAEEMGSKISGVKRRIEVRKASARRPVARVKIRGNRLNLAEFKARQVSRGVSAAPWGRRRIFPSAFLVRIGGHRLVMKRQKVGRRRVGRLPIEPLYGPGHAETAASERQRRLRQRIVDDRLPLELKTAIEFLTRRFRS